MHRKRRDKGNFPLIINLTYGGTVQNGVDVQTLPPSITIPANEDSVLLNIIPLIDGLPEGIETLKIYTLAGCAAGLPTDSSEIQIRDYDILGITPDTLFACRNAPVQLNATAGYGTYIWDAHPALSSTSIANPVVTLPGGSATFICTATLGTCNAKDSSFIQIKEMALLSKQDINCNNASTGQVKVTTGPGWATPIEFSIDGGINFQPGNTFDNLPVGNYTIIIRDGGGCIDSLKVALVQAFATLTQTNTTTAATCTGNADGTITINAAGGKAPYQYSLNGAAFVNNNVFNVKQGVHTVVVKDANGCTVNSGNINIALNNNLAVNAGADEIICEGTSVQLNATANLTSTFSWSPAVAINNTAVPDPVVSPVTNTKYIVTATSGICTNKDSLIVNVNPAPIPDAGADITICYGASTTLNASGAVAYNWTPSTYLSDATIAQPAVQKPLSTTRYFLNVKDANGCASLVKDTVDVIVTPAVKLFAGNDSLFVAINQPVQLNVTQQGVQTVTQYSWSPAYGLSSTTIKNPVAILDRDITYYVTGKTNTDCEGVDTINIKVYKGPEIYVPNAFTPNGDGRNDLLKAIAVGMKAYNYFRIYNRYGELIFETTKNFDRGWDGRIKGAVQGVATIVARTPVKKLPVYPPRSASDEPTPAMLPPTTNTPERFNPTRNIK
ncbi:MAG: T9SS type B sorting domain-containing protein [Sphingobacteriales bacterium]|nr:MAG: T9SS type B sorting domain-containing protein [Sphingobacteriales bacterium]